MKRILGPCNHEVAMNLSMSGKRKKNPRLCFINSPGISFGYPEPEFVRLATYFSRRGHEILVEDLRINIYSRQRRLFAKEIQKEKALYNGHSKLKKRIAIETANGLMEDYLFIALAVILLERRDCSLFRPFAMSDKSFVSILAMLADRGEAIDAEETGEELRAKVIETLRRRVNAYLEVKEDLLQSVIAIIGEEVSLCNRNLLRFRPDVTFFFISQRKIRETIKHYKQTSLAEYLFPLLVMNEMPDEIDSFFLVVGESLPFVYEDKYLLLGDDINLDMIIYQDTYSCCEAVVSSVAKGEGLPLEVPGTMFRIAERFHINPPHYPSSMKYSVADYSLVNLYKYIETRASPFAFRIDGSASCPMKCAFCHVPFHCGPYRQREASDLAEEMMHYHKVFQVDKILFNDRIFNADIDRLRKLCDLLYEKEYAGSWSCYAAIRPEMNEELLKKMRRAGCLVIAYGVESGSARVLRLMKKEYAPEQASRVIRDTYRSGIEIELELMTDFPGETDEDFQQTLAFLEENFPFIHSIRINQFELYEGCDVYLNPSQYELNREGADSEFRESLRLRLIREFVAELEKGTMQAASLSPKKQLPQ
jgi:radical SAM superfamily enzyme YgiQ (UPF0313 family)